MRELVALALACATACAFAQSYPTKPIRFIVPFAAGGGSDLVARTVAQKLTEAQASRPRPPISSAERCR